MTTLAHSLREQWKPWHGFAVGGAILIGWFIIASANFRQPATDKAFMRLQQTVAYDASPAPTAGAAAKEAAGPATSDLAERKIVRTSSLDMVVQSPADAAEKITALAEALGGHLESSNGGGQNATSGVLTIRVPVSRFHEAKAEIRKLGLRVEGERVDAQDVTRQYVDQDARIRNLRVEETQLLSILKQAQTVKDMMAVSERISEVRGQIEQQQAEFSALSRQIETVAIAISLRTESQTQVLGLNWRPLYELKVAAHDGLESIGTYATAMMTVLFFLPGALLWTGTILAVIVVSWRICRRINQRWFTAKATAAATQTPAENC